MKFPWGFIQNLYGIKLGNNARVTLLQEIFHMVIIYDFKRASLKVFESEAMSSLLNLMYNSLKSMEIGPMFKTILLPK
jgi:hypothetical protein